MSADDLLDRLAAVGPSRVASLNHGIEQLCRAAGDGPVVCLLGAVGPDDVVDLVRARSGPTTDIAILADLGSWAGAGTGKARRTFSATSRDTLDRQREDAATLLRTAGWQVATARADLSVAQVWATLGGPAATSNRMPDGLAGEAGPVRPRRGAGMTAQDLRTALAAALATLLGAGALRPVYATGRWFPPVLAAVLVVFAGGLVLRAAGPALWARVARGRPVPDRVAGLGVIAVPLGQAALLACLFSALYAPSSSLFGFLPTSESLADVAAVLTDGAAEVQEQAPPALPLTGLVALTTLLVGIVAIVVDLIAVAGRQAGVAGLGLLVLYCVPVGTISGGIGFTAVAAPAAGLAPAALDRPARPAGHPRSRRAHRRAPAGHRHDLGAPHRRRPRWSRDWSSAPSSRPSPRARSPPASAAARAAAPGRPWTRRRTARPAHPARADRPVPDDHVGGRPELPAGCRCSTSTTPRSAGR